MSNTFTSVSNLCKDPESLTLGERELVKLRLACNTFGKNAETRFFDALVGGPDADAAIQLKQGDQIVITGQLVKSSYKSKKGKLKGKSVECDSMPFAKILQITKSPSFFSGEGKADADDGVDQTEAPDLGDAPADDIDGEDPLADVL
jgi:single-stranded DNA-binding protein